MRPATSTTPSVDPATVIGIALVGVAVGAYSAVSLFGTAREAGVPKFMAWVLPVATDVCALVCTRVWLSTRHGKGIQRYAAAIVLADMLLSFVGASLHLVITAAPIWLKMAVGGVPSLSLAATVHLGALIAAERAAVRALPVSVDAPGVDPDALRPPGASASSVPSPAAVETARRPARPASNVVSMAGVSNKRAAMLEHLDANPATTGKELDELHGTSGYGRKVRRDWERSRASGE